MPYKNSLPQRRLSRSEQKGVFPQPSPYGSDKLDYIRTITDKHLALQGSLEYKDLGNRDLPIHAKRDEVTAMIRDNRVSMLEGETGSGKTSQLWQYLLGEGYDLTVVLVPRIVIADNVYERAVEELSEQRSPLLAEQTLGLVHGDRAIRPDGAKVMIMTAGSFSKMLPDLKASYGDKSMAIVSDEIHEADLPVELATAFAAESLADHDEWRLILSSATQNKDKVQAVMAPVNGGEVPVVTVEGRPHDIELIEEPDLDMVKAYLKYRRDENGELRKKVLLFQPGKQEGSDALSKVNEALGKQRKSHELIPAVLHAKITHAAFELLMQDVPDGKQMVIASTSAGQSGITIPGVSLVLTDGRTKRSELDNEGTPGLFVRDASQAEIMQQTGRAGRDVDHGLGVITRADHDTGGTYFKSLTERDEHAPPQIYQTNIMRVVLTAAGLGHDFSITNQYLLSQVDERTIVEAKEALYRLGALDTDDRITELGRQMDLFPFRPELARGVVEAWKGGHSLQMLANVTAVASALEVGGLADFDLADNETWKDLLRETTRDDCIAQLDMFQATREHFYGSSVNEEQLLLRGIDPKNAYRAHRQWNKAMQAMGLSPHDITLLPPHEEEEREVRDILLSGMVDYIFERTGSTGRDHQALYQNIHNVIGSTGRVISSRSLLDKTAPSYVVGFPRRYQIVQSVRQDKSEKQKGDAKFTKQRILKHVVENGWPLEEGFEQKLAQYAGHLVTNETNQPKLDASGRLYESTTRRIGSIVLNVVTAPNKTRISPEAQELLVSETLAARSSDVQRVLRKLIHELKEVRNKVPERELPDYFDRFDFPDVGTLQRWVAQAAEQAHSVGEVNAQLRARLYEDDRLHRSNWISDEKLAAIYQRSPESLTGKNGRQFHVTYEKGIPIINHMKLEAVGLLPPTTRLPDGREILFRVQGDDKRDSRLYDISDLMTMRYGVDVQQNVR
jgi:HrpA-like RNA helicase